MCRILFGADFVHDNTVMTSLTNCNSPLVWAETVLSVIRAYAASSQARIISPFIMQGANTPITTAGGFSQLDAEALAEIAYAQLVRTGAPVIYGATLSTVSMKSGAPPCQSGVRQGALSLDGRQRGRQVGDGVRRMQAGGGCRARAYPRGRASGADHRQ